MQAPIAGVGGTTLDCMYTILLVLSQSAATAGRGEGEGEGIVSRQSEYAGYSIDHNSAEEIIWEITIRTIGYHSQ